MDTLRSSSSTRVDAKSLKDQDVARALREAMLLTRLARFAASNLTFTQIVSQLFRELSEVFPVDRLAVVEFNVGEQESSRVYCETETADASMHEWHLAIARAVAQSQTPIWQPGHDALASWAQALGLERAPMRVQSLVAVPLVQQGNVSGALILESFRAEEVLTEADVSLTASMALPLALILERERAL
ncbi:MAG TPA: GAF domain-containing protein, partial [Anaerolineae bacterium]|nr:GAF domain-containing protein [Anaerolineae bacterium]